MVHNLADTYEFKGNQNAIGKLVKDQILNNELNYECCANAMNHILQLIIDLKKCGK